MKDLVFDNNNFFQNVASENGFVIYVKGLIKAFVIQNNNFSNNSYANKDQKEGSALFLENPGNLSIINSNFKNNLGISGTCISYSETSKFLIFFFFIN